MDLQDARTVLAGLADWTKLSGAGVALATFAGFSGDGHFLVALSDALEPVRALSTVGLSESEAGARVVVAFEKGDVRRPVIVGRVQPRATRPAAPIVRVDGERIVFHADREIELRCGDASLVLTAAGKVLIRGNYVSSRSRGANKVKGAFVDIN